MYEIVKAPRRDEGIAQNTNSKFITLLEGY